MPPLKQYGSAGILVRRNTHDDTPAPRPVLSEPLNATQDRHMQLKTRRLLLREYTQDDFEAVHAFASDAQVAEFVEWGPNSPHDTRRFLTACVAAQDEPQRRNFTLAITEPNSGPVGSVSLSVANGLGTIGSHSRADNGDCVNCGGAGYGLQNVI